MTRTAIIMYHRVACNVLNPYSLCVSPEHFIEHLEVLARRCSVVTLDGLRAKTPRPRVVVTFDDGYADNFEVALPILEAAGLPFIVYVTSGLIGDHRGLWWDRLAAICATLDDVRRTSPPEVDLEIDGQRLAIRVRGAGAGDVVRKAVHRRLRRVSPDEIEHVLAQLVRQLDTEDNGLFGARVMTADEVRSMSANPLCEIGAHTARHELLAALTPADQEATITASKRHLERLLGRSVVHFAYPFGGPDALDRSAVRSARLAGFATAVTTSPGAVTPLSSRWRLPRYMVHDWSGAEFSAELERWGAL